MQMKRIYVLIIGLGLIGMLFASGEAANRYLKNPSIDSFSTAIQQISADYQKDPGNNESQLYLAYIANQEAKRLLDDSMSKLDSLNLGELFFLGNLLLSMDKYPDAVSVYDRINVKNPKWSCPWRHKGEALYKAKDFQAAATSLEKAIETKEDHYDAYVWYAKTLYELKRYQEARTALEKALTLDAEEEDSHFDEVLGEDELQTLYRNLKALTK